MNSLFPYLFGGQSPVSCSQQPLKFPVLTTKAHKTFNFAARDFSYPCCKIDHFYEGTLMQCWSLNFWKTVIYLLEFCQKTFRCINMSEINQKCVKNLSENCHNCDTFRIVFWHIFASDSFLTEFWQMYDSFQKFWDQHFIRVPLCAANMENCNTLSSTCETQCSGKHAYYWSIALKKA